MSPTDQPKEKASDGQPLLTVSKSEAFLLASLLSSSDDVGLTESTILAGLTLNELPFLGPRHLFMDLKPRDALECLLAGLIVFTVDAAHDCFAESVKDGSNLEALDTSSKYGLRLSRASARLLMIFERAKSRPLQVVDGDSFDRVVGLDQETTNCDSVQEFFRLGRGEVSGSILGSLLISSRNAAARYLNKAKRHKPSPRAREIHLRYALMAVDTVVSLLDALELCRDGIGVNLKQIRRRTQKVQSGRTLKAPIAEVFPNSLKLNGNRANGRHP
jgi:hypothetical protein